MFNKRLVELLHITVAKLSIDSSKEDVCCSLQQVTSGLGFRFFMLGWFLKTLRPVFLLRLSVISRRNGLSIIRKRKWENLIRWQYMPVRNPLRLIRVI